MAIKALNLTLRSEFPPEIQRLISYAVDSEDQHRSWLTWSSLSALLNNAVARAIYVIPVAGYVILYSDYFSGLFQYSTLSYNGFLSFFQRVSLAYYGSIILLVAFLLWLVYAPTLLRNKRDLQQFISEIIAAQDFATLHYVSGTIRGLIEATLKGTDIERNVELGGTIKSPEAGALVGMLRHARAHVNAPDQAMEKAANFLHFYYNWQNQIYPRLRMTILFLAVVGYGMLALPALDLFIRVLATTLRHLFY
jgi:hypothetical protein